MGRITPSPNLLSIATVAGILTLLASTCMAKNVLRTGEQLYEGQSLNEGRFMFTMQDDCNLVLYEYSNPIWASNTGVTGKHGCRAVMQSDGNFVIYDGNGSAVWASNSIKGNGNYVLVLQEDGNVVIYGSDIWATGTYRRMGGAVVRAMKGSVGGSMIVPVIVNQNVTAVRKVLAAATAA